MGHFKENNGWVPPYGSLQELPSELRVYSWWESQGPSKTRKSRGVGLILKGRREIWIAASNWPILPTRFLLFCPILGHTCYLTSTCKGALDLYRAGKMFLDNLQAI
jgi:hypothetical protein